VTVISSIVLRYLLCYDVIKILKETTVLCGPIIQLT